MLRWSLETALVEERFGGLATSHPVRSDAAEHESPLKVARQEEADACFSIEQSPDD